MLKILRYLLFPFSLIYAAILWLRNLLFDKRILKSISYSIPSISVGNLSVGGTGKTPMIEYLIRVLKSENKIAILSRGYKRRSSGFLLADENSNADQIGDEPFQMLQKFPEISVCVGEDRVLAIPQLLYEKEETELILLDDAFQHRYLNAGFHILLTSYNNLFTRDWYLPTGNLRDLKSSKGRADIIIVSKCPADLDKSSQSEIRKEIELNSNQHLFFSSIRTIGLQQVSPKYSDVLNKIAFIKNKKILLLSGIAHSQELRNYLEKKASSVISMKYSDHHYFTENDLDKIHKKFQEIETKDKIILTTEKDWARLQLHKLQLMKLDLPIFTLPVEVEFLNGESPDSLIKTFLLKEKDRLV